MYNEELRKRDDNYTANMARLVGYIGGAIKEVADPMYPKALGQEWVSEKLLHLRGIIDHVWENRYDRVVDFEEYTDPSLRLTGQKGEALEK